MWYKSFYLARAWLLLIIIWSFAAKSDNVWRHCQKAAYNILLMADEFSVTVFNKQSFNAFGFSFHQFNIKTGRFLLYLVLLCITNLHVLMNHESSFCIVAVRKRTSTFKYIACIKRCSNSIKSVEHCCMLIVYLQTFVRCKAPQVWVCF